MNIAYTRFGKEQSELLRAWLNPEKRAGLSQHILHHLLLNDFPSNTAKLLQKQAELGIGNPGCAPTGFWLFVPTQQGTDGFCLHPTHQTPHLRADREDNRPDSIIKHNHK